MRMCSLNRIDANEGLTLRKGQTFQVPRLILAAANLVTAIQALPGSAAKMALREPEAAMNRSPCRLKQIHLMKEGNLESSQQNCKRYFWAIYRR